MTRPAIRSNPAERAAAWLLLALYIALITFQALKPPTDAQGFPGLDKLLHAGAFAVMLFLVWWALGRRRRVWLSATVCFAFGVFIEIAQALMPYGREPSVADLAANAIGIVLAGLALKFALLSRRRE